MCSLSLGTVEFHRPFAHIFLCHQAVLCNSRIEHLGLGSKCPRHKCIFQQLYVQPNESVRLGRLLQDVAALQELQQAFLVCQMTMSQRNKVLTAIVPCDVNGDERLLSHLQHAATGELLKGWDKILNADEVVLHV